MITAEGMAEFSPETVVSVSNQPAGGLRLWVPGERWQDGFLARWVSTGRRGVLPLAWRANACGSAGDCPRCWGSSPGRGEGNSHRRP